MRINQRLTAVSEATVITAAELRTYAKAVNISGEDSLVDRQIKAAVRWVEQYIGKSINSNTFSLTLYNHINDHDLEGNEVVLNLANGPITSITSVTGYNTSNEGTELVDGTDYFLLPGGRLRLPSAVSYESFVIVYVAGMEAIEITDAIKEAVIKLATELYAMRGLTVTGTIVSKFKSDLASILASEREKLNW